MVAKRLKMLWFLSIALCFVGYFIPGKVFANKELIPFPEIGDGKPATSQILTLVDGIAVDSKGNIYISHRSKNRIRKIDKKGIITTVAGNGQAGFSGDGGPALEASLNNPAGLAFDKKGNLFIADRNNHRIRKVSPHGIITTVAGNGVADFDGDDGPATKASLNLPSDVAATPKATCTFPTAPIIVFVKWIPTESSPRLPVLVCLGLVETMGWRWMPF